MEKYLRQHRELLAQDLVKALEKRNFESYYAKDVDDAKAIALSLIPKGATVASGGSVTLGQAGIIDAVKSADYNYLDRANPPAGMDAQGVLKAGLTADVYLTSSNAVTRDGQLVNIDGNGNRVAAMLYGPDKVIVVVGTNKITEDVDSAVQRVKDKASPPNTMRLGLDTPCAKTGRCADCRSASRICNMTTIMSYCRQKGRVAVIVVPEELGF